MINRAELTRRLRSAIKEAEGSTSSQTTGLYVALGIVHMMPSQRTGKPKLPARKKIPASKPRKS